MRTLGKIRKDKFVKMIKKYFHEIGAVSTNDRIGEYEVETKAGTLKFYLYSDFTYLFSVFARFTEPKRAVAVLRKGANHLNPYSGKWNFHHNDEMVVFDFLQGDLEPILINRPITKWDDLKTDTNYEGGCKMIFEKNTLIGDRGCIDEGRMWNKPKHVKMVMVDACACFVQKSTPFQLWLGKKV